MKKTIKKILESLGLLAVYRMITKKRRSIKKKKLWKKYDNIRTWHLTYRNLNLSFDVSDVYSKGWFYPRYDNGKIHEPLATDIFIDHIRHNSQVLDIGGHLGYFSCIAGELAKNGKVHVFEVDPKCMNLIQNNLNINKLHNVEIHNYAVSDSKGFVKIPKNDNPNPSLVINSSLSDTHIEVESMLIDDFLSKNNIHPDFIKMDIEGAEGKALEGMKNTLAHENATLLVEIHVDVLKNNFDTDYKEIIKQLIKYGYTLTEIEHRKSDGKNRSIDPETELEGNTMILCKKINKKNLSSIET